MSSQDNTVLGNSPLKVLESIIRRNCWACDKPGIEVCVEVDHKKDEGIVEYFCGRCNSYARLDVNHILLECDDDTINIRKTFDGLTVEPR